jgi:LytS/YehU family sensor histidine kinase
MIVGVTQAVQYYKQLQKETIKALNLRNELFQSQLKALKAQIHPHFLFNTHNAIISLMYKEENEKAILMLSKLSDLLRLTLERSESQIVTLKEEINFVNLYLDIQKIRFEDKLTIVENIEKDLLSIKIPSFILQPIIENALEHGVVPGSDTGIIELNITSNNLQMQIMVKDNGVGLNNYKEGIGLSNIRSRLAKIYNNNFELRLTDLKPTGTRVEITIPLFVNENNNEQYKLHYSG